MQPLGGLYTLCALGGETKTPFGSSEVRLGVDPKGVVYQGRPRVAAGGQRITSDFLSKREHRKAESGWPFDFHA